MPAAPCCDEQQPARRRSPNRSRRPRAGQNQPFSIGNLQRNDWIAVRFEHHHGGIVGNAITPQHLAKLTRWPFQNVARRRRGPEANLFVCLPVSWTETAQPLGLLGNRQDEAHLFQQRIGMGIVENEEEDPRRESYDRKDSAYE